MLSGIIAPTKSEADLVIRQLSEKEEISIQGKYFYKGSLGKNIHAVICICGIGKANAAHGAALLIERFKPNLVYVIGVGGAYPSSGLHIGDIVIAEKEIYGDEGLSSKDGFRTLNEILDVQNEFIMYIPEQLIEQKNKGTFVTVSTCTGTLEKGKEIEKRFNAICENMEGAAIAHICAFSGIPAAEIRGISNIIEDRTAAPLNKADIIKAAENAQRFLLEHIGQACA
ncbi:MAG: futalosine hydrolase [Thermodesulfovibrionales bacterium]|jgi:futalosine hydrolase|nr:futalosine hydrolase [Thermodesulfovibrionales bacterium]